MFGLERFTTVSGLVRGLNVVFTRLNKTIKELVGDVESLQEAVDVLDVEVENVKVKQNKEKNISCFASVYHSNPSSPSGWFVPFDAAAAPTSAWYRRRLNNLKITGITEEGTTSNPLSSDYFSTMDYGTATAGVRILKPGKYKARAWTKFRRCNSGNASLGIYYDTKPTSSCTHEVRCATGSTAVGTTFLGWEKCPSL